MTRFCQITGFVAGHDARGTPDCFPGGASRLGEDRGENAGYGTLDWRLEEMHRNVGQGHRLPW